MQCNIQKDLGIIISDDFSWSAHYSSIVSKALVKRVIGTSSSITVRKQVYVILVRSQLLYCSHIWRSHLIKDIKLLESVQRKATKWILNDYKMDCKLRP
jgi:hypothetical protein